MPYLIKTSPDQLFLLDYNSRTGLFYKVYSGGKALRTTVLYSAGTEEFTAAKDGNNNIHVVCKNRLNQIIHFSQRGAGFQQQTVLDDYDNNFNISNLHLTGYHDQLHLFYTAKNLDENTINIVQHQLGRRYSPRAITTVNDFQHHYECQVYEDHIFLLSINKGPDMKNQLSLNAYDCGQELWEDTEILYSSSHPITHSTMCFDKDQAFHILITTNQFGQYSTSYMKINVEVPIELEGIYSCPHNISPVIFSYDDTLWVNWKEKDHAYMLLSADHGLSFSEPRLCSLQDANLKIYHYYFDQNIHNTLYGSSFYGLADTNPVFAILNQMDMDQIHMDSTPNNELKLFLDALKEDSLPSHVASVPLNNDFEDLQRENDELKNVQRKIAAQYEELSQLAKDLQAEGKKWRSKFFSVEMELRTIKNNKNSEDVVSPSLDSENPLNP